ncbi:MAG TPA: ABC transporter ATP-binding protein [Petrotogaceae bacterium]|jgi:ATP-binding cassette subfamily B protein|nr:ABC transporter ATP-binding protein [Petrotogaceae bacterium]
MKKPTFKSTKLFLKVLLKSFKLFFIAGKAQLILLLFFTVIQGLVPIMIAQSTRTILDSLNILKDSSLTFAVVILVITWGFWNLINFIINPLSLHIQGNLTDKLILSCNLKALETMRRINDLSTMEESRFFDEQQLLEQELAWRPVNLIVFTFSFIRGFITVLSMMVSLIPFHPLIPVLLLLSLMPQAVQLYRLQQEAFENMVERNPLSRKMQYWSHLLLERTTFREAKIFGYESYAISKYQNLFSQIYEKSSADRKKKTVSTLMFFIIGAAGSTACFLWVISQFRTNNLSIGSIGLFSTYIIISSQSFITLIQDGALLYDTCLFMDKYFSFIDRKPALKNGTIKLKSISSIEFRNVTFYYPGTDHPALKNLSFKMEGKKQYAIVGENGSGKTTILNLICRFYDPQEGQVLINGYPLSSLEINSYRTHISMLFQDYARYELTAKENISISDTSKEPVVQKINDSLKNSGLYNKFSTFADGIDQQLGKKFENGTELSGGEWQKVALARSLYRDCSLFILDEPSSSMDAISQAVFWKNISEYTKNKLSVMVTHKVSSLKNTDCIFVLKNGSVAEQGKHSQLTEQNGLYSGLLTAESMESVTSDHADF